MPCRFELDVVGHPPPGLGGDPRVHCAGVVPRVAPWYERAQVAIVPVFEGSGTRLKIPEALAYGRPVVSTSLGAEGLPLKAGEHFMRADDPDSFAQAILSLARGERGIDVRMGRMLDAGRDAASKLFWPEIVTRLSRLYRDVIADEGGRGLSGDRGRPIVTAP